MLEKFCRLKLSKFEAITFKSIQELKITYNFVFKARFAVNAASWILQQHTFEDKRTWVCGVREAILSSSNINGSWKN